MSFPCSKSMKASASDKKRCWPRGWSAIILLTIALCFHVASVTTPLIVWKHYIPRPHPLMPNVTLNIYNEVRVGLMKTRVIVDVPGGTAMDQDYKVDTKELPGSCEKIHQMVGALRAFFFVSLALCAVALIAAGLNAMALIPSAVPSAVLMLTVPCSAIGAIIAFLIWENVYCKDVESWADREGAKIWTATPFIIVAAGLEKITWILSCALPKAPHDELGCCSCSSCCNVAATEECESPVSPNEPLEEMKAKGTAAHGAIGAEQA